MISSNNKIPCSVAVLTFNSEKGIRRCLDSVRDFEEIVICDGGSTDETLKVAKEYGATILEQDSAYKTADNKISDFSGVRNQMLEASRNKWFLVLDSDEYLSKESGLEICAVIAADTQETPKLFHVLRKYEVSGKIIDHAGTYPSYQPRFFHKNHVEKFTRKLHEKIVPKPGEKYGYLTKPTIVPVAVDPVALKLKYAYYLQIEDERNAKASASQLLNSIMFSFRGIAARWIKIFLNMFRSGTRMPLSFEIVSTQYSLKLTLILFKFLIRKI